MSAVFERLQTLAFMKQDSRILQTNRSISHAISSPELLSQSLKNNSSFLGKYKENSLQPGHKRASLAIRGSISKRRISIRILKMREEERANLKLRPIRSVSDWALNVNSYTMSPNIDDETSSTDSWNLPEVNDSSQQSVILIQHQGSEIPGNELLKLNEETVVEIHQEREEGDSNQNDCTDDRLNEEYSPWWYCCLLLRTPRTQSERRSSSMIRVMQTQPSLRSTGRTLKLNILSTSNSYFQPQQSNEIIYEEKNSKWKGNNSLKEKDCSEIAFNELSEIDALWTDNPHWVQPEDLCTISALGVLGRGVEGGVTGVLHIPTCNVYALKSTNYHSEIEKYLILKKLAGENQIPQLMSLKGLFVDARSNKVALVLDYMNLGSLHDEFTSCDNPCSDEQMRYIARETLLGLRTLHGFKTPVLHCDIKPNNILISSKGSVRIGDYGLLKLLEHPDAKCEADSGTVKYFSPERYEGSFAMPADIWALGVSLVECLIGRLIEPERLTLVQIESGVSPLDFLDQDGAEENVVDFLRHCLEPQPEKRWEVERLLCHPLFIPDFLPSETLFSGPKRNEALLKEILGIVKSFIQQRVQLLGRASSMRLSQEDHVWSSGAVSHEDRLQNILRLTGYTKEDVRKLVDEMYEKQVSNTKHF